MPLVAILGFDLFPFRLDRSLSANGIGGRNDALIVAIILHQLEWIIQIIGPAVAKIANELQRDVLLHARHLFRSEEHTYELQSLMRISYAVFCLKKKKYEL